MKTKEIIGVLIFFLGVNLIFFNKLFFGLIPFPGDLLISQYQPWRSYASYPTKNQYFDTLRQIYPWKTESLSQIKQGHLPLWNPYNFSGTPLLANFQSAVFYPLNFLYFLLPQISAWTILILLQPFLASFFTYLFVRSLGLKKLSSVLSGLSFGFSLFMSTFLEYNTIGHVVLWLPLILLSVDKIIISKKRWLWALIFIFSLCSSFFAGHLQIFSYIFIFSLIYLLFRWWQYQGKIKTVFIFSVLYLIFSLITIVQWLPTLQLIQKSARVSQDYNFLINQLLIQPRDLIRFLSPDIFGNPAVGNYLLADPYPGKALYIGLLPIIFAFLSLWQIKKSWFIKFFSFSFLIIFLFLLRLPLTEWFYKIEIPLFSTSSPSNVIFLLSFCLAILAGFGFEEWQKKSEKAISLSILIFVVLILILIFVPKSLFIKNNLLYSLMILMGIISLICLGIFKWKENFQKLIIIGFIGLTVFDLYYFFNKFNPFVPIQLVYPSAPVLNWLKNNAGISRIWGYGTANIESNFFTQEKLFGIEGYDPLYIKRYGEFIQAGRDGKISEIFNNQNRSDAVLANGFGSYPIDNNSYRKKMLNLLGVKYILNRVENGDSSKIFPTEKYKLVYQDNNGWQVFENLEVLPRVFLTSDYKVFKTKEDFGNLFFNKKLNFGKTILLETDIASHLIDSNQLSKVKIVNYSPNDIKILVEAKGNKLLFLSDSYYPGWKAYIDEKPSKIYRADYTFRAVEVPAGEHRVVFRYEPWVLQ